MITLEEITARFVKKLNDETTADNWESIIDKYELEIPEQFDHEFLCEKYGIEVWGVSKDEGRVLVYDHDNGWWLRQIPDWIEDVLNVAEEVGEDKEKLVREIPVMREYFGYLEKKTTIQITIGTLEDLKRKKLVDSETWESVIKRLIKDSDAFEEMSI